MILIFPIGGRQVRTELQQMRMTLNIAGAKMITIVIPARFARFIYT